MLRIVSFFLFLLITGSSLAQERMGVRVGYFAGYFSENPSGTDAYKSISFGIPIEFEWSKLVGIRLEPSFYRHGYTTSRGYEVLQSTEDGFQFGNVEGEFYTNFLRFPISAFLKPKRWRDQFYFSPYGGFGFGFGLGAYRDLTITTSSSNGGEDTVERIEGKLDLDEIRFNTLEIFSQMGLEMGINLDKKQRISVDLGIVAGLSNMNASIGTENRTFGAGISLLYSRKL